MIMHLQHRLRFPDWGQCSIYWVFLQYQEPVMPFAPESSRITLAKSHRSTGGFRQGFAAGFGRDAAGAAIRLYNCPKRLVSILAAACRSGPGGWLRMAAPASGVAGCGSGVREMQDFPWGRTWMISAGLAGVVQSAARPVAPPAARSFVLSGASILRVAVSRSGVLD